MSETVKTVKYRILGEDATTKAFNSAKAGLLGIEKAADKALKIGLTAFVAGSTAGAAALVVMTKQGLASVDALAKTSDKLGVATDKLQAYRKMGDLAGISMSTMDMAMQRMVRRVSEAGRGTGEAVGALRELGISAQSLAKMSPDKQFDEIAKAMGGVSDQGDRVRLAMKLFDSEGVALVNTMQRGNEQFLEAQRYIDDMGLALSRVDASKVETANDRMADLKDVLGGLGQQLAVAVSPLITEVSAKLIQQVKDWGGVDTIVKKFVDNSIYGIGAVIDVTQQLGVVWLNVKKWIQDGVFAVADGFAAIEKGVRSTVMAAQNLWNGFFHHLKGGWLLMVQSASGAMESLVGVVNKGLGSAVDVLNELIQKANNIPGIKINEIEFGEGLGEGIRKFAEETRAKVDQHFASKPIQLTFDETFDEGTFEYIKKFWSEIGMETRKALAEAENAPPAYKKFLDALESVRNKAGDAAKAAVELNKNIGDVKPTADEAAKALFKLAQEGQAKLTGLAKGAENFANGFGKALENMAVQGKFSMKTLTDFIIAEMVRIAVQQMVLRPLFGMIGGALFGMGAQQLGTGFAQASANLGGGGLPKASGGPVSKGEAYTVGEGGKREAFIPDQNGRIIPMDKMGGDTIYIDARGADQSGIARLERILQERDRTEVRRVESIVQNAFARKPAFGMR